MKPRWIYTNGPLEKINGGQKKGSTGACKLVWLQRAKRRKTFKRVKWRGILIVKTHTNALGSSQQTVEIASSPSAILKIWKEISTTPRPDTVNIPQRKLAPPIEIFEWPHAHVARASTLHPRRAMKLTDEVFRSFRVAKVFRENTDRVNCIDFSANGEHMICSSNDDSIVIYCCQEGRCALNGIFSTCVPPPGTADVHWSFNIADQKEPCTVKSMAVTCSSTHMLPILSSTPQIKLMVSWHKWNWVIIVVNRNLWFIIPCSCIHFRGGS